MRPISRRVRVLLLGGAVLLPSAVLLVATVRFRLQDRELEAARRAERRTLLAASLGQELFRRLEDLRGEARTSLPDTGAAERNAALVVVARVDSGRLVFPWAEVGSPVRGAVSPAYERWLEAGEAEEFRGGRLAEAAASYGRAAEAAGADSARRGAALLGRARVLARMGRNEPARALYLEVSAFSPSLRDDDGMPLALYAAEGALGTGAGDAARPAVEALTEARTSFGLAALYGLRDLASAVDTVHQQVVARRIAAVERMESLERELPRVLSPATGSGTSRTSATWLPIGPEPWLVSAESAPEEGDSTLVVAAPAVLLESLGSEPGPLGAVARGVRLTALLEPGAEDLGPYLSGLRAVFSGPVAEGAAAEPGSSRFVAVLPLVIGFTLLGGWLLWQDLQREVAAAALRSQFVASVSHELKTPLTSIRMYAETLLLGRDQAADARREYLETIVRETERLTRHINDVLDFSRVEAGQLQYHFAPTDLGEVVRDSADALSQPLTRGGFDLVVRVPDRAPVIEADRDALTRVVQNLLTNAMKFAGDSRAIELSVAAENGEALVRVQDWGRGIAPEDRDRIFERFYRGSDVVEAGITGVGLGLPLVAHAVKAHGGRLELESVPNQGSTFSIRLPMRPPG